MNKENRYQANPDVSCGDEEDGAVLYNPDTDNTSIINLTGRELWSLLETPRTLKEMVDYLLQKYSCVSAEQASEDIQLFVETLTPDFLLKINDDS